MKLGEALNHRSELSKRLATMAGDIPKRLTYVVTPEGNPLTEEDKTITGLIPSFLETQNDLMRIIFKINITNANTFVDFHGESRSITELIALREYYSSLSNFYNRIASRLKNSADRKATTKKEATEKLSAFDLTKAKSEGVSTEAIAEAQKQIEEEKKVLEQESNKTAYVLSFTEAIDLSQHFSRYIRETDTKLQEVNWNTELV